MSSISGGLKQNLDNILQQEIHGKNLDWVHVNVGGEGKGKSSFSLQLANYIDPDFTVEDQVAFSGEEFREMSRNLDSGQVIVYDEAVDGLFSGDHSTKENKKTVKFLRQMRELNLYVIINLPVFHELDKKIREHRVKTLSRCVKQGWAHLYSQSQLDSILDNQGSWPSPRLKAGWKDPAKDIPEIWSNYQEKKLNTDTLAEEKSDEDDGFDGEWVSTGTAAEMLDVSGKTVRNWCDDGTIQKVSKLPNGDRRIPRKQIQDLIQYS